MKKTLAFFTLLLGLISMFAQSGPTFPYQAVVRNSQNQLIKDSTFAIGVEVYQGADLKYSETQSVTTNANGQFTMNIGGGTLVSGAMNGVADWSVAKFKITYHLSEGDIVSENAVNPVPYALQAANVAENASLDCADVINCIADTLNHYTTTTALEQMLQQISVRMDAQEATIDSLRHLVDSLSDLSHGGGSTPSAIFFCDSSTVKDVDQNEYHTVAIGNQCWMKENLRTKTHTYGSVYTNPDIDSVIYGRYYDWEAIMQVDDANSSDFTPTGIHQGICPTGWHVPSQAEWDTLISYVNSETDYKCDGNNGYIANALSSDTGWESPEGCCAGHNSFTLNKTGFSAVPSGFKLSQMDSYYGNGWVTFIGSSTQSNRQNVRILYLRNDEPNTNTVNISFKKDGVSVRCLRDAGIVGNAGSNESGIGSGNTPSAPATMSCEDVIECMGDTLGRLNARITSQGETIAAQGTEIETLSGTVTAQGQTITVQGETIAAQGETIDSLAHIVDSLSNLPHGGGDTPTEVADGQPCPGAAKVQDADNNEYNTVKIGNQCWMAQNLRTTTRQYGNVWTNSDVDSAIYGRYYDWQAAMQIDVANNQTYSGSDVKHQGICPTGWHVPSDAEWDTLTHYVFNSTSPDYKCGSSCGSWSAQSNVSCIAKALSSTTGWNSNTSEGCNAGNTGDKANATGFAAVPAGGCLNGNSSNFGDHASFWSATQNGVNIAWSRTLHGSDSLVRRGHGGKGLGFSVRCLRDAGIGGAPGSNETAGTTPSTPETMSCEQVMECMGDTLGRLNARITSQGETIAAQGETIDSLAHIVDSLSNLNPVTPVTPTDTFDCGTDKVKDAQNNEYNTVQIGDQCWTKENLRTNVGTGDYGYPTGVSGTADTVTYGRLYSWEAVMNGASASSDVPSGVRGICPEGWHVPSDGEWGNLINYVKNKNEYVCDGEDNIANALSSETGWTNGSTPGCNAGDYSEKRNQTGFSAVPAGYFDTSSTNKGTHAYFWSTTDSGSAVYYRYLDNTSSSMNSGFEFSENMGLSVRCLRN